MRWLAQQSQAGVRYPLVASRTANRSVHEGNTNVMNPGLCIQDASTTAVGKCCDAV